MCEAFLVGDLLHVRKQPRNHMTLLILIKGCPILMRHHMSFSLFVLVYQFSFIPYYQLIRNQTVQPVKSRLTKQMTSQL